MNKCNHCSQTYTGLKADHFRVCRAIGYALGDVDYSDMDSAMMSKRAKTNAKLRRRKTRGPGRQFGRRSPNFKK